MYGIYVISNVKFSLCIYLAALCLSKPSGIEHNYDVAAVSRRNHLYGGAKINFKIKSFRITQVNKFSTPHGDCLRLFARCGEDRTRAEIQCQTTQTLPMS